MKIMHCKNCSGSGRVGVKNDFCLECHGDGKSHMHGVLMIPVYFIMFWIASGLFWLVLASPFFLGMLAAAYILEYFNTPPNSWTASLIGIISIFSSYLVVLFVFGVIGNIYNRIIKKEKRNDELFDNDSAF